MSKSYTQAHTQAHTLHLPRRAGITNRRLTLVLLVLSAGFLVALVWIGSLMIDRAALTDFTIKNLPPSLSHPFGTDWMGRDMFVRTIAGLSISIRVGLVAAGFSSCMALVLGACAALGGSWANYLVTTLIDIVMGIPHLVLLMIISYACGRGTVGVCVAVALTHWGSLTRVVRAEILQCRQSDYCVIARQFGRSRTYIALHHMLPHVFPQFIVGLILLFPHAILHEASITFLGFGLPSELPAIGVILSEAMSYLSAGRWWLAVFPGVALVLCVLLFDACGTCLRVLSDPHSSQE